MYIIVNPSVFEIQEFLDCIAETYNLDDFFPLPANCTRSEMLAETWCYLFYDNDGNALGLSSFVFGKTRRTPPLFGFATTRHCKFTHLLKVRKRMLEFMDKYIGVGVRVYIINDKLKSLALKSGFKATKINNVFYRGSKK